MGIRRTAIHGDASGYVRPVAGSRIFGRALFLVSVLAGLALLYQAFVAGRREPKALEEQTAKAAREMADLIIGAVEHSMLQGEGITVGALMKRLEHRIPEAKIAVYDQRGIEVFGPKPKPPHPRDMVPQVVAALTDKQRHTDDNGTVFQPIPAERRCTACHDDRADLRGVLALELAPVGCIEGRTATLTQLVHRGFTHVMTARKAKLLDGYFRELAANSKQIRSIAVFDDEGEMFFGAAPEGVDGDALIAAARTKKAPTTQTGDGELTLIPLTMNDRCVACHDDKAGALRGVLAIWLTPPVEPTSPAQCDEPDLETIIETSLRYIMLSRLGRRIADFLDAATDTPGVKKLTLYDNAGRRYWSTEPAQPLAYIADVLKSKSMTTEHIGKGETRGLRVVAPLLNRKECARCHGSSAATLGAVSVTLSTAASIKAIRATLGRRAEFTTNVLLGALLILGALVFFTRR